MPMKNKIWIFMSVIFLLLSNLLLGEQKLIGGLLLFIWLIRILLLRDKEVYIQTLICLVLFIVIIKVHELRNITELTGTEEHFLVSLDRSSLKVDGDYLSFTGKVEQTKKKELNEKVEIQYYIQSIEEKEEWINYLPPKKVLIKGTLVEPSPNTNFNQFNYQEYLKRRKINWQLKTQEISKIEQGNKRINFMECIDSLRFKIIHHMNTKFHEKVASYLKVLFMAEGSALAKETKESYQTLGLIHLFSISGFHISYLAKICQRLFLRLGISHERTNIILLILLPFYGLLAGMSVSIFRAVMQKMLQIISVISGKKIESIDAWALTMIFSLIMNPYSIFELSFQLSYCLSGVIIIIQESKWLHQLTILKESLFYSLLAMLISLPFLAYHFYEISWLTVISNLLFIPLFSYLIYPSLSFLFMSSFLFANSAFFLKLNKLFATILLKMELFLSLITELFDFNLVIGRLPYIILALLVLIIIHLLKKIEQQNMPSVFIILSLILCLMWNRLSPIGYVIILDVGQGDSILIKEPNTRKVSLIDTGGQIQWQEKEEWQERDYNFNIGQNIVVPTLKSFGISTIDRLYISHPHEDHMGEICNISQKIQIKEIAGNKETLKDQSFQEQVSNIRDKKIVEIETLSNLDYPTLDSVALHPILEYQDKNNQSLVLYVKIGEDYWLFTGDLEKEGEKDLIQTFPSLKIDYLKVGHHGSSTSSTNEFLECVAPRAAFISVGKKNSFGHPSEEIIQSFLDKKIEVYSTKEEGSIKIIYFKIPFTSQWLTKIETVN